MELAQLHAVLQACISQDPTQRKAAEGTLTQAQHAPGVLVQLLQLAADSAGDSGIRQVAVITFKNVVKRHWESREGRPGVAEADKQQIRSNLVPVIISSPPYVRSQCAECIRTIIYADYPERWPDLLSTIQQSYTTQDQAHIHGALIVLRCLARKYEFKDEEERQPLVAIVNGTFPTLMQIFLGLIDVDSPSLELAEVLKLICKVFWSTTWMGIPDILLQESQFVGWMTGFHKLLVKPVPQQGMPRDPDERPLWPWWKTQKWVQHIAKRLFDRYGDPKSCKPGTDQQFAELWSSKCSMTFLQAQMQLVSQVAQGQYLSPRVTNLVLQYLTHAVKLSSSWKALKPEALPLLQRVIFPLLCFNEDDARLWQDDPQEFIRKGYDILEDMYSPKTAAMNFVHEICKTRAKGGILEGFMGTIITVLSSNQKAGAAATQQQAREFDGALLAVGALVDVLKNKKPYKDQLERMLVEYVEPAFRSPHGHLRAKACWVAGTYADIQFEGGAGKGRTFQLLMRHIIQALQDPELPVKVDATMALRPFMEEYEEEDIAALKPLIPQLLNEIFMLMSEVEADDLVVTLEGIVEKFGEEIAPYAVGLCQHLTDAFNRTLKMQDDDEDDQGVGALAAFGCLRALSTTLESVSSLPHLFPQLEEILYPVLQKMCTSDGQDVFEEVLELLSYFTFFGPEISPRMWSLFPRLHQCYMETQTTMPWPIKLRKKALRDPEANENDVGCAPKLLEVILQACRGRVDEYVEPYLQLVLGRLAAKPAPSSGLKDLLLNVVADALFYNPELTLNILQKHGALAATFSTWSQMIFRTSQTTDKARHFRRMYDKKVNVLGLSAVMGLPDAVLPPEVQAGLPQLMAGALTLLVRLRDQEKAFEEDASTDEAGNEADDEHETESDGALGDEQDEEEDSAYLDRLAKEAAKIKKKHTEEEEGESEEEWTDEEDEFHSPLEDVNPYIHFSDCLQHLQTSNPQRFQALTSTLDAHAQPLLQGVLQYAEEVRRKPTGQSLSDKPS
ncbi:hypothetical protein WJX74_009075 [Apatococcus lobatus]|uniref:Importin N-terminal domain-containing protein n=1 Tax=Apatococcus lobatus TaxID=904363 RepID=A0AAW1QBW8_9CHLO